MGLRDIKYPPIKMRRIDLYWWLSLITVLFIALPMITANILFFYVTDSVQYNYIDTIEWICIVIACILFFIAIVLVDTRESLNK
jgi:hypothetical protein